MKTKTTSTQHSFEKILSTLAFKKDNYTIFSEFTTLAACAVAEKTREDEYNEIIRRCTKEQITTYRQAFAALIVEMLKTPFTDLLGPIYMDFALSAKGRQAKSEFHTPKPVADLIAAMLAPDPDQEIKNLPTHGLITVCEPACGAGAIILSFAKRVGRQNIPRLDVTAIDINKICCDMCFINTSVWEIPARIYRGDALNPQGITQSWPNVPWLIRHERQSQRPRKNNEQDYITTPDKTPDRPAIET